MRAINYAIAAYFLFIVVIKLIAATQLDLFADEAFYWQCGQRPDLAYADLPLMTAMTVRLGTWILGDYTIGVRFFFWLAGLILPILLYYTAKARADRTVAWQAAGAVLVLPGLGYAGFMAIPDTLILLFIALFLFSFERATRTGSASAWSLVGFATALGLMTHYRFVLAPASAVLYLVFTRSGRSQLLQKGPWLAGLLALPGLIPAIVYNLKNRFEPLTYFIAGRHGTRFHPEEILKHVGEQALIVTPLLYVTLIAVLVGLWRRARRGDDRAALFFIFSAVHLGLFLLASPLHDTGPHSLHWPLPGYLPLLLYLPDTLGGFLKRKASILRKTIVTLVPGIGAAALIVVFLELTTGFMHTRSLRAPFTGWSQVNQRVQEYLSADSAGDSPPLIVADNYKLGANLEFMGNEAVYILDHSKNYEHGRQRQFDRWGIGEKGLLARKGQNVLLIIQWSEIPKGSEKRWPDHVFELFEEIKPLGTLNIAYSAKTSQKKSFRFYAAVVRY